MTTYTQEEVEEIEAELFDAQELLEKQDDRMKDFEKNVNPMISNTSVMLNIVAKLEHHTRGTGYGSPQLIWELKSRLEDLDDMLHGRPKRNERDKVSQYVNDRIAFQYGSIMSPSPSSFKINAV